MSGIVKEITDDIQFQMELANAKNSLVVVDFSAEWCGPCKAIAPLFNQMPQKYPKANFLKVDVDKCSELAATQGVSAMPTFIFFKNKAKIDRIQGADFQGLENKIKHYYGNVETASGSESDFGLMELTPFIMKNMCECLNESNEHILEHCIYDDDNINFLASDCDEQLIISITFNQAIKLHSLKFKASQKNGPKNIKLFINQPVTFDFDQASSAIPIQEIEITPKDLTEGNPISLRFVKFQNVQNIIIFVINNQSGSETTIIQDLKFIGTPVATVKMNDFKRISGKKGESH